jgi:hypothetical protein
MMALSLVDVSPVADFNDKDIEFVVFDSEDEAIVADAEFAIWAVYKTMNMSVWSNLQTFCGSENPFSPLGG